MGRIHEWLSDSELRAKVFRWFWLISLLFLLVGYAIIILRLL